MKAKKFYLPKRLRKRYDKERGAPIPIMRVTRNKRHYYRPEAERDWREDEDSN